MTPAVVSPADRFAPRLTAIDTTRRSSNHGERVGDPRWPDAIVLHYTGMRDAPSAIDWLCEPASQVSCHYVVGEDGTILQLVDETRRAWHAGRSCWAGVTDMNSASVGIEIVNGGHDFGLPPFPDVQIDAVIALCGDIARRHAIPPERILAHSDIAPSRKRDPGERFPWARLAAAGIGRWVEPPRATGEGLQPGGSGPGVARLQSCLGRYGYAVPQTGLYDGETEIVVRAFQRRFRPTRVDGIADGMTCALAAELCGAMTV